MKLGIIGTGNVGGTLGKAWASQGHQVMFGVRDPHNPKVQALLEAIGARASTGTVAKAAASAEVVILAVPWTAAQEAIRSAGDERQDFSRLHQPSPVGHVKFGCRSHHLRCRADCRLG